MNRVNRILITPVLLLLCVSGSGFQERGDGKDRHHQIRTATREVGTRNRNRNLRPAFRSMSRRQTAQLYLTKKAT